MYLESSTCRDQRMRLFEHLPPNENGQEKNLQLCILLQIPINYYCHDTVSRAGFAPLVTPHSRRVHRTAQSAWPTPPPEAANKLLLLLECPHTTAGPARLPPTPAQTRVRSIHAMPHPLKLPGVVPT